MNRRTHAPTTTRPTRVTYTPSPALSHDEARLRTRRAYRFLLGLEPWPTPPDRQV